MNIENLSWLAGFFEGEGTTGLYKYKRIEKGTQKGWRISTYVSMCNNDALLINEVAKIIKAETGVNMYISTRISEDKDKNHNTNYAISAKSMTGCYKILQTLRPFLRGTKLAVAEITMRFIEGRKFGNAWNKQGRTPYSKEDDRLYQECKKINQRGVLKTKFESSETLRQTITKVLGGKDKVRTSMKVGEIIRNELST